MNGGLYGMIAGDANADGSIDVLYNIDFWNPQAGETAYLPGDENLGGQVNNRAKNEVWLPNYGKSEILPE